MRLFALASFCCLLSALAQPAPSAVPNLNAVLWVQTSAEYAAIATQTYRAASRSLKAALQDPAWTAAFEQTGGYRNLPPAVILDLDETVLDNSPYQARLVRSGASFSPDSWDAWVKEKRAGAVPGAVPFLHEAVLNGVTPFYITNRTCNSKEPADPTIAVLKTLRIPHAPERVLCRAGESDKSGRRLSAAATHRILLLIGDDFNDFTSVKPDPAERESLQKLYAPLWGEKWFMLPNPAYGSWESAIGLGTAEKIKRLRE